MKLINKIPYFIIIIYAWIIIISSCANQGMPTGGPRDTIPPEIVSTIPKLKGLNYTGDEVRITFNEFIIPDAVSEVLVVSPPLEKRPTILTKSKTLIIKFNENLKDSTTYSLDFKNSVADNNEKNPYNNLRFSFSTGNIYDSLRVAGIVMDAFNMEPVENTMVMLHENLHDSAVFTLRPDYIARTDENGIFLIDNIPEGKYNIFSVNDANSDLKYDESAEQIAFLDSLIIPEAEFHQEIDTLIKGLDSILVSGHTHFKPGPLYLRQFTEDIFMQYLDSYKRDSRYKCTFIFNESVADTFNINLLNADATDWYIIEPSQKYDSLTIWISDKNIAENDTLVMELSYIQLDSLNKPFVQNDTLSLNFSEKKDDSRKRRKSKEEEKKEETEKTEQFAWTNNISSSGFDLNKDIILTSPEPVKYFDNSKIFLFLAEDSLKKPINFIFSVDSSAFRSYRIKYAWEPETEYTLQIDSAACENIYNITSEKLDISFKTRKEDYYGTINLKMEGITEPVLVQLVENNDNEEVIRQKAIKENSEIVFDYLAPNKYKIKIIIDSNDNGVWDTGSFQDKYQPEKVSYINEVIKVRSNWDNNISWELKKDAPFIKNIVDKELEEQRRKEQEEKAKKEREEEDNPYQQQDNMFSPGGFGPGNM
jgi:hypothetical protein